MQRIGGVTPWRHFIFGSVPVAILFAGVWPVFAALPSTPLAPADALKTFRVAPGFRLELVAAEPLVEAPVALAFDTQGRIWVCEMRGYMPDLAGDGEQSPNGRITVLEDTHGTGHMDKSTVYLDGFVLPRALAIHGDGILVAEPPNLVFCHASGPGGMVEKTVLASDYASGKSNPEHLPNGLLSSLDNWIYNAESTKRYRFDAGGKLVTQTTISRGQWGIAQDDVGRLFYNYNSSLLHADFLPAELLGRNPALRSPAGLNVDVLRDQTVFPSHATPGVNRGYQKNTLRADGSLRTDTAACGPAIYRGDLFPAEFRGNAFVCEPAGNLVRRNVLTEHDGVISARNGDPGTEFLTSTDERFRPVNLYTGPDGALYVVDMYRGIIQHKTYVTPYLHDQIVDRGLEGPTNMGRIYRVVPEGANVGPLPKLARTDPGELVARLSHPNGWWRDTAQRLLVERGGDEAVPALTALAESVETAPLGRLHALWTLEGLEKLTAEVVLKALGDTDPRVRAAALRLAGGFVKTHAEVAARVLAAVDDPAAEVRLAAAGALGGLPWTDARTALGQLLTRVSDDTLLRDCAISGMAGRELEFLEGLLADPAWAAAAPGRAELLGRLAGCVFAEGTPAKVARTLDLIPAQTAENTWRGDALLNFAQTNARGDRKHHNASQSIEIPAAPEALERFAQARGGVTLERVGQLETRLTWPGKAADPVMAASLPLTASQQKLYDHGRQVFSQTCAACHQPSGQGQAGLAPPLAGSAWVDGSEKRIVRIALHGLDGDVTVNGEVYHMDMPPMGALSDEDLASALTYIRRKWSQNGGPVEPATVASIRAEIKDHAGSWTEPELLVIH